jgi:hypothetical protein
MPHGTVGHPDWQDYARAYAQILARAWRDEKFKDYFVKNAAKVFKEEYGIKPHEDFEIDFVVCENTNPSEVVDESAGTSTKRPAKFHLVLPAKPSYLDLLQDENLGSHLNAAATRGAQFGCVTFSCAC